MATLLPPPSKKQKREIVEKTREQQEIDILPRDLGSVVLQFIDESTGKPTKGEIKVPVANTSVRELETILNTILENTEHDRVPYRFAYKSENEEGQTVDILSDLYQALIKPGLKTTEDVIRLHYTPQAVFRVKAVSRCSAAIAGHGSAILAIAFSPVSSSTMVTGSGDNTARIYDCDTGTPIETMKGHTDWVLAVSFSPNGQIIATGSKDKTVRLWSSSKGKPLGTLKGHSRWINSLSWEPYHTQEVGRPRLASASKDTTVRIWDVVNKKIEMVLSHKDSVTCVRWGGIGKIYTASLDKTVRVWSAKDGTLVTTLGAHTHRVNHLALSTDFVLRTAFHDHTHTVPESDADKVEVAKKRFEKAATIGGKITERLVSASDDFTMYLWDPESSSKPVARMLGHQKAVNHVTFSPDGAYIASAAFDNHVKLWNARDGKFINTFRGHVAAVYQCCFSADSRLLVSASQDSTLKIFDVRTGKLVMDLPGHEDQVFAVDWSPDGERVGSGGADKKVRIWRH